MRETVFCGRVHGRSLKRAIIIASLTAPPWGSMPLRAQDPPYRSFTVADGLPSNTVYSCAQDGDGRLWFGTDAGAARWDGQRFEHFNTTNGLVDNEVLSIFIDSHGRVWLLSLSGKLCFYAEGRFHDERDHPELASIRPPSGFVSAAESPSGTLWFSGQNGPVFAWRNGRSWEPELPQGCPGAPIGRGLPRFLHVPREEPWLILNSSIFRARGDTLDFTRCWEIGYGGYPLATAYPGGIIALSDQGIVRLRGARDELLCPRERLPQLPVMNVPMKTVSGDIWLPAYQGGVVVFDSTGSRMRRMLRSFSVNTAFQDAEGNIWLNTAGNGTIRIDPWQQRMSVHRPAKDDDNITAVLATRDGRVLFGTSKGSILLIRDGEATSVIPTGQGWRERVRDLQEGSDGRIWFTTDSRAGYITFKGDRTTLMQCRHIDSRTPDPRNYKSTGLKALATGPNGRVIGSFFGIAELKDTLGYPTFITRARFWPYQQRMYAPFVDRAGDVWFETNDHLHRVHGDQRHDFPSMEGRCGSRITDIDQLPGGTMVIATAGNGVVLMRNEQYLRKLGRTEGLPSDQVRAAVVHGNELLIAMDAGACSITDPTGDARIRTWGVSEGFAGIDVKDIDRDSTMVYMATGSGLFVVPAAAWSITRPAPRLDRITATVNDSLRLAGRDIRVRSGDRLVLRLDAVHLSMPELIRYEMRDDDGGTWTSIDREILMNMPPSGEHDFSFRVNVPGSAWSTIAHVHLSVVPPWHERIWFRVLIGALVAGAVVVVMWSISRRKDRMHKAQLARHLAIQEERQRIASDMHDDIGADISHLLMMTRQYTESVTLQETDRSHLGSIERAANGLLQKIDEVIWSLAPQDDRLYDALSFIQRYAETFAEAHGMAFRTQPLPALPEVPIHSRHRREVYLMVKEVLHNIAKHTSARTLRFSVMTSDSTLSIRIEDDGAPLPATNGVRNGHGKTNLRLRAERIGAQLRSEPITPSGTAVTIELPLTRSVNE